jgi:hypothetical protein
MITAAKARELLVYDSDTGILRWRRSWKIAGCRRKDGYIVVRIDGTLYLAHRICWLIEWGEWPDEILDHVDQDPSNNRLVNLREVTHSQNHVNMKPQVNNTSGYLGVDWHKGTGKWRARVQKVHLGLFSTKEEAIAAATKYRNNILERI